MIKSEELLHIGKFTKPHGKVGEMACVVENDYLDEAIANSSLRFVVLSIDNIFVPFVVENVRQKNADTYLFTLEDITSEEKAQQLCSLEAYVLRCEMPENFEEEISYSELQGFSVIDEKKGRIGIIKAIDESTINTLIELGNDVVLPLHEDFIVEVDIESKTLVLNLPDGLI